MNKTLSEAEEFIEAVKNNIPANDVVDAVVGAPNIFTQKLVEWTEGTDLKVAAQNSHFVDEGAFTGESSPKALAALLASPLHSLTPSQSNSLRLLMLRHH